MKNTNKGFTLIELLAVIVILAIIALIATPIIMKVVDDARMSAAKDSAYGYIDGVNNFTAKQILKDTSFKLEGTYTVSNDGKLEAYEIPMKGTKITGGILTISNNKSTGCLTVGNYKATIAEDKVTKIEKGSCDEIEINKKYDVGSLVYFDPVNSEDTCDENSKSTTCYKWRVIEVSDSESKSTITLQMDHNLINRIEWAPETNTTGPVTVLTELNKQTTSWTRVEPLTYEYDTTAATSNYGEMSCTSGTCKLNGVAVEGTTRARMITGEEVRNITNTKVTDSSALSKNWTVASSYYDSFFFSNTGYILGTKKVEQVIMI